MITAVIIVILFAVQSRGTESIGKVFGSVVMVWFAFLAIVGVVAIGNDGGRDRHGRRQHRVRQEGRAAEHGRYDEPCAVFANQRVQSKDDSAETDIQTSQFTSHMTDSPESDTQNTFFGTQTSDSAESDTCAQVG